MCYKKRFFTVFLIVFLLLAVSCEMDQCDPPFAVFGGSLDLDVVHSEPIKAGKDFGYVIRLFSSSITNLKDIAVEINFPPELEIESIIHPADAPRVLRKDNTVLWKATVKPSFISSLLSRSAQKQFTLWVKSRTDWEKWSSPITVNISLDFKVEGRRECPNYPSGFYSRTITWSHEGYSDPDWQDYPNGYRGVWK